VGGGFNKPVFVNSNKFYNKNEGSSNDNYKTNNYNNNNYNYNNNFDNKSNNKQHDFKQKQNYNNNYNTNSSLTERPKFFSNKPADENRQSLNQENIVDKYNMSYSNNVYSNPNRNSNNE